MTTPRIETLKAPYDDDTQKLFDSIMPEGMEPLNIFKTMAIHPAMFAKQMATGGFLLYNGDLDREDRELILHRTCARCGSEYEWGVHVNAFARPLGFSEEKIRATVTAASDDPVWSLRESLLIRVADELHDTSTISEDLWNSIKDGWSKTQILEMIAIAGNYHGVSYLTNALKIDLEETAERFPSPDPS